MPDGSAHFEAPADTPLFLEPLDAAGRRLQFEWNYPVSSVPLGSKQTLMEMAYIAARPGEVKSCNGCHAPQDEAARQLGFGVALTHKPVRLHRDVTTDVVYRRNEPDEYRLRARIGEAPKYRPWLSSPDAELRRRGCEMLMAIEDGARSSAAAIARLLRDDSVAVRRAAALALGRLGAPDSSPALVAALEDPDWEVRFHAATALEAITACAPPQKPLKADGESTRQKADDESTHRKADDERTRLFCTSLLADLGGAEGLKDALGRGPSALAPYDPGDDRRLAVLAEIQFHREGYTIERLEVWTGFPGLIAEMDLEVHEGFGIRVMKLQPRARGCQQRSYRIRVNRLEDI